MQKYNYNVQSRQKLTNFIVFYGKTTWILAKIIGLM